MEAEADGDHGAVEEVHPVALRLIRLTTATDEGSVLLQTEDGLSQALTGKMSLKFMHMWQGLDEEPLNIIPSIRGMGHKPPVGARR